MCAQGSPGYHAKSKTLAFADDDNVMAMAMVAVDDDEWKPMPRTLKEGEAEGNKFSYRWRMIIPH